MVIFVKRGLGQVSGFTILGIVLVAMIILLFFLRGQLGLDTIVPGGLSADAIKSHVTQCLREEVPQHLERIGLQGGHLRTPEGTYRLYQDVPVSYLCYNTPGKRTCQNRMLTLPDMEKELGEAIGFSLDTCLDFGAFRKRGYELSVGQRTVLVAIGPDATMVTVTQPIHLVKGDLVVDEDTFSETFAYPLGRLYGVSQSIVDTETTVGEFDQLPYMLTHKGEYVIDKKRPYPDKLYLLQTKDSDYLFQFFIQDEPSQT